MKPSFFIVGAAKSGTTSLYHYLKSHPEVYMCPIKEPNFFSCEEIREQNLYYEIDCVDNLHDYGELFIDVLGEKAIGEASVSYMFYPQVARKIKENVPDAKIIIMLRNPVQRGFSHYLMDKRLGYVDLPFKDVVYKQIKHPLIDLYYQQYVELGLYCEQVERYLKIWGENRVKIVLLSDFQSKTKDTLFQVCDFLGINNSFLFDVSERHNMYIQPKMKCLSSVYASSIMRKTANFFLPLRVQKTIKKRLFTPTQKPSMDEDTSRYLLNFYKKDIMNLQTLLKINLEAWFSNE